jgi:hypothetical protein
MGLPELPEFSLVVDDGTKLIGKVLGDALRDLGLRPDGQAPGPSAVGADAFVELPVEQIADCQPAVLQHLLQGQQSVTAGAVVVPAVDDEASRRAVYGIADERGCVRGRIGVRVGIRAGDVVTNSVGRSPCEDMGRAGLERRNDLETASGLGGPPSQVQDLPGIGVGILEVGLAEINGPRPAVPSPLGDFAPRRPWTVVRREGLTESGSGSSRPKISTHAPSTTSASAGGPSAGRRGR